MNLFIEDQFEEATYKIESFDIKGNYIYGKCNKEEVLLGRYFDKKQAIEEYNKMKKHIISENKDIYKMSKKTYNTNGLHFKIKNYNIDLFEDYTDIMLYNEDNKMINGMSYDCKIDESIIENTKFRLLQEEGLLEIYKEQQAVKTFVSN